MSSDDTSTTIAIKTRTRKRLSFARDSDPPQPDYDSMINLLLDLEGYPSYQEVERIIAETARIMTEARTGRKPRIENKAGASA